MAESKLPGLVAKISADVSGFQKDLIKIKSLLGTTGTEAKSAGEKIKGFASPQASAAVRNLTGGVQGLIFQILALAGVTGVIGVLIKSLNEFGEAQVAALKLSGSLSSLGDKADAEGRRIAAFASELESLSGVSDEAIIGVEAMLASFNLFGPTADRLTTAAANLSARFGGDIEANARKLAFAIAGNSRALREFGIQIDKDLPRAARLEAILAAVEIRAGGAAEAMGQTLPGQLKRLGTQMSNIFESIGALITDLTGLQDPLESLIGFVKDFAEEITKIQDTPQFAALRVEFNNTIDIVTDLIGTIGNMIVEFEGASTGAQATGNFMASLIIVLRGVEIALLQVQRGTIIVRTAFNLVVKTIASVYGTIVGLNGFILRSLGELARRVLEAAKDMPLIGNVVGPLQAVADGFESAGRASQSFAANVLQTNDTVAELARGIVDLGENSTATQNALSRSVFTGSSRRSQRNRQIGTGAPPEDLDFNNQAQGQASNLVKELNDAITAITKLTEELSVQARTADSQVANSLDELGRKYDEIVIKAQTARLRLAHAGLPAAIAAGVETDIARAESVGVAAMETLRNRALERQREAFMAQAAGRAQEIRAAEDEVRDVQLEVTGQSSQALTERENRDHLARTAAARARFGERLTQLDQEARILRERALEAEQRLGPVNPSDLRSQAAQIALQAADEAAVEQERIQADLNAVLEAEDARHEAAGTKIATDALREQIDRDRRAAESRIANRQQVADTERSIAMAASKNEDERRRIELAGFMASQAAANERLAIIRSVPVEVLRTQDEILNHQIEVDNAVTESVRASAAVRIAVENKVRDAAEATRQVNLQIAQQDRDKRLRTNENITNELDRQLDLEEAALVTESSRDAASSNRLAANVEAAQRRADLLSREADAAVGEEQVRLRSEAEKAQTDVVDAQSRLRIGIITQENEQLKSILQGPIEAVLAGTATLKEAWSSVFDNIVANAKKRLADLLTEMIYTLGRMVIEAVTSGRQIQGALSFSGGPSGGGSAANIISGTLGGGAAAAGGKRALKGAPGVAGTAAGGGGGFLGALGFTPITAALTAGIIGFGVIQQRREKKAADEAAAAGTQTAFSFGGETTLGKEVDLSSLSQLIAEIQTRPAQKALLAGAFVPAAPRVSGLARTVSGDVQVQAPITISVTAQGPEGDALSRRIADAVGQQGTMIVGKIEDAIIEVVRRRETLMQAATGAT